MLEVANTNQCILSQKVTNIFLYIPYRKDTFYSETIVRLSHNFEYVLYVVILDTYLKKPSPLFDKVDSGIISTWWEFQRKRKFLLEIKK